MHLRRSVALLLGVGALGCGARTEPLDDDTTWRYDGAVPEGVDRSDCPDPNATYVYVVTTGSQLASFHPPTHTFRKIGFLDCPDPDGAHPNSMAVDRKGTAFVSYSTGHLYQVSTKTGACTPTSWVPRSDEFLKFGMGFATDLGGPSEKLYVASYNVPPMGGTTHLGSIDLPDLGFHDLAPLPAIVRAAELTGTGDGRLFGFYTPTMGTDATAHLAQLDKKTGAILTDRALPGVQQHYGWAMAFWGGDFFFFTAPTPSSSIVTRLRPSDSSLLQVASFDDTIVGAGVSTCAPEN